MQIASGITIMWPSTNGTIPANWSRVTSMDDRYSKGTAAGVDPDVTGGAATHTHIDPGHTHTIGAHTHTGTTSGNASPPAGNTGGTNFTNFIAAHTHTSGATSGSSSSTSSSTAGAWQTASSDPTFRTVIWIESNGSPTGFPANSWALWDKVASLPTNWSNPSTTRNTFFKGAAAAADGGTTGGGSHQHTANSHTHAWNGHTHTGSTSGATTPGTFPDNLGATDPVSISNGASHTHAESFLSGSTQASSQTSGATGSTTYEPTWAKLLVVQNDVGSQDVQARHVAVWRGLLSAIPTNWVLCDGANSTVDMRGKHLKGANSLGEISNTGGTDGHSHTDPGTHTHAYDHNHAQSYGSTAAGNAAVTNPGGANTLLGRPHTHSATSGTASGTSGTGVQGSPSNADTQPPFRTAAFIALTGVLTVNIDSPTTDQVMTSPSFLIDWSISGGTGVQNDYRVIVYDSDQTTVVYDSTQIASSTTSQTMPSGFLLNNHSYYIEVTVHDTGTPAVQGSSGKQHITTAWTPPATITGIRAAADTTERPV